MNHHPRTPNRLARETSPYLLQHAQNPVDWYPWGEEAFAQAKLEDKPMLLSIGYSACHWCHVMERESFENDEIAGLMNEHFVCVKVDREERPDVDGLYMTATIALSGSGGWPMTVFLTPDREPFFAGTYFPPDERDGRPGFRALLRRVAELWKEDRSSLLRQASELTAAIRTTSPHSGDGPVGQTALERAIERLSLSFDERFGGFGGAPKFPPHGALTVLVSHVHRTQDPRAESMLRRTLDAMASGGIHDHLGGGFARYSTDAEWLVPHFEKMLCDNAQLGRIYAEASVVLGEPRYEVVARKTIDYVLRELLDPCGGFYSATDADSEGEEGKYFVWSQDELVDALGAESATHFSAYYGAVAQGNWEGKNVLHTARSLEDVAADVEVPPDELEETLACARQVLLEVRGERVPPAIDDQVITAHNALMISTLAEASRLFGESRYREAAERAARFILRELRRSDGGLLRTWRAGAARTPGFLDDHAYLADALIDLYEAGGDREHLATARALAVRIISEFSDSEAGDYYTTTTEHDGLLFRDKAPHDGALPHATAIAARAAIRLSRYFDDPALLTHGHRALRSQADLLERSPHAALTVLRTLDLALDAPIELVLVGDPESPQYQALARALGRAYLPSRVLVHYDPSRPETEAELPIVRGKTLVAGEAALYVCGHGTCHATVTAPEGVAGAIQTAKAFGSQSRAVSLGVPRLVGSASSQGTERFMQRHAETLPPAAFVELVTGLRVSRLGIAARRTHGTAAQQRRRLGAALGAGINLIDVTAGSAMEETELFVGEALAEACASGTCHREEIVIVSKVGPIRGRALALLRKRRASGKTAIRSLRVDDSLEYSVEPQWLEQHLTRVLERLGLDCLDAYLIDAPELLLTPPEGANAGAGTETPLPLYASLETAFRHLEGEVLRGRIRFYGISTNAWQGEAPASERLRLGPILDAALAVGGADHRFRIIEVPLNLVEQGVLAPRGHEQDHRSILAEATARGVSVLTVRPLSAQWEGATLPLREPPQAPETAAPEALSALEAAEHEFAAKFAPLLRVMGGTKPASTLFDFRETLERTRDEAHSPEEFEATYLQRVAPAVAASVRAVDSAYSGADSQPWQAWRDAYLTTLAKAVGALRHLAGAGSHAVVETLASILDDASQSPPEDTSLANRLLWLTCHAPGVTSTVVEWGSEAELDEGTRVLRWPAPTGAPEGFDAVLRNTHRLRTVWREATGAPGGRSSTD